MKVFSTIFFILMGCLCFGQTAPFWESFDEEISLSEWYFEPGTYYGGLEDDKLIIQYNKTSTSDPWAPIQLKINAINLIETPELAFKLKSNQDIELGVKLINCSKQSQWISKKISQEEAWQIVLFDFSAITNSPIKEIYIYINGGQVSSQKGIVTIDDLKIGTTTLLEKQILKGYQAINTARQLLECSTSDLFLPLVKEELNQQIKVYHSFLTSIQPNISVETLKQATLHLYQACSNFELQSNYFTSERQNKLSLGLPTFVLLENLKNLDNSQFLYGMQDAVGYGVGWTDDDYRSDIQDVCGSLPALFSWEINKINQPKYANRLKNKIKIAYQQGGVNTLVWHLNAPNSKSYYAKDIPNADNIVPSILPGGSQHKYFKDQLDQLALFALSLRDEEGQSIPLLFRPFHEHNGQWFWWGRSNCKQEDFLALWRFTVNYLRTIKRVNNLLFVFSPDGQEINLLRPYTFRYPGDDYVDILGLDFYFGKGNNREINRFIKQLEHITDLATLKGKIAAVCEVGDRKDWDEDDCLEINDLFTRVLLYPIKKSKKASRITYLASWRNASKQHHFAPYPGHPSVPSFYTFYEDPATLFLDDLGPDWLSSIGNYQLKNTAKLNQKATIISP